MKNYLKRQNYRMAILIITWLFFPVVLNYLSPYVIIDGAFKGIITGSFILFTILFLSSVFVGRLWCGWVCPAAGLQEVCFTVNNKAVKGKQLDWIKWAIWGVWLGIIFFGFITAGGIKKIDPLHLTENIISVNSPESFVIYYFVTGTIFALSVFFGKRTFCHAGCWMAPFMISGRKFRNLINTPSLRLTANTEVCINCGKCTRECTMSLDVNKMVQDRNMENAECILCGNCVDTCPQSVIHYTFKPGNN